MRAVLSPYHLTTREPAAMAALLLAEEVVTLLPRPRTSEGTRVDASIEAHAAAEAASRVPTFAGLVRSWEWTMPLWRAGVLVPDADGDDALGAARTAAREIETEARFASLRGVLRPGLFDDGDAFLLALCADVLKAGPDPALGVPLQAGLDLLASRHGLMAVRSDRATVVQRAEQRMGTRLGAFAAPVLVRSSAERLLAARDRLAVPLDALRRAVEALVLGDAASGREVSSASHAYAAAFETAWPEVSRSIADEERAVAGTVAVTLVRAPAGVSLLASLAAAGTLHPDGPPAGHRSNPRPDRTVVLMVVRLMGRGGG